MKNKVSYLKRKTEQLHQWERVIDNLIDRANKTEDKERSEIFNQIENINVKKKSIENQLKRFKVSGDKNWQKEKVNLEKSWKELRNAFSNHTLGS